MRTMLLVCVLALGCGGGKKSGDSTMPTGGGGGDETEHVASNDNGGVMIPPEKMDEIERLLRRKDGVISRCLAVAIDNKEVPKNTRGRIGLEVIIDPSGHATSVKVTKSDIEAESVRNCVIGHVKEIAFPELPKQYETSHTYVMETI